MVPNHNNQRNYIKCQKWHISSILCVEDRVLNLQNTNLWKIVCDDYTTYVDILLFYILLRVCKYLSTHLKNPHSIRHFRKMSQLLRVIERVSISDSDMSYLVLVVWIKLIYETAPRGYLKKYCLLQKESKETQK